MKIEIFEEYKFKIIRPDDENNWLTNGEVFSKELTMPLEENENNWQEVEINIQDE